MNPIDRLKSIPRITIYNIHKSITDYYPDPFEILFECVKCNGYRVMLTWSKQTNRFYIQELSIDEKLRRCEKCYLIDEAVSVIEDYCNG